MHEYRLYYAGFDKTTGIEQIGVAVSDDLKAWRRPVPGPIVPLGSTGEADAIQTSNPCVLRLSDGYRMWYQGRNAAGQISICHARSVDGIRWVFFDAPVLAVAPEVQGNRVGFHHPHVLFDTAQNIFRLWCTRYQNDSSHFLYAESSDGESWKILAEDVLRPTAKWEGRLLFYPCVVAEGERFSAWYSGIVSKKEWRIGRAVSADGVSWTKDPVQPILPHRLPGRVATFVHEQYARFGVYTRSGLGAFGTASPNVWKEDASYHMFTHDVGARGKLSIGHYISEDGVEWQQVAWDILAQGRQEWDAFFQGDPFLIRV